MSDWYIIVDELFHRAAEFKHLKSFDYVSRYRLCFAVLEEICFLFRIQALACMSAADLLESRSFLRHLFIES